MDPANENFSSGVSFQEYLAILRRRRMIILQAFVLISVVGVVLTLMQKPVYQAGAKLLVEGPSYNLNTVDANNPLSQLFELGQQQTVDTQVEVLQAQPLLDAVMKQSGPASISVSTVKDTNVIEVMAESTDPRAAAAAPNTLLKMFIDQNTDQSLAEMERARQFVESQGKVAHAKLIASETALKNFQLKTHTPELLKSRDAQIASLSALSSENGKATTDLIVLRAQIAADEGLLRQQPATLMNQIRATNTVVLSLQEKIRDLEVQRVGMIQPGGLTANAPQVRALDAQIGALEQRIALQPTLSTSEATSPNGVHEALRSRIVDLEAQVAPLKKQIALSGQSLKEAQGQIGKYATLQLVLDRLTRQHDAAQADDKNFSTQLADLVLREKAHHATAHIIESAQVPTVPVRPKKLQSIIFDCLIGLFVGICLALLQEFLDDRINSAEEATRVLGLPSLGHVPALTSEDAHLLPQMKGLDPASESYRVLRTNIHFASVDAPARTLLVTSSNPGEGKTTTAANLAFAMAMDGKTVILVDTDLRRPSLHKLLNLQPLPGLTDVLLGHAALQPREVMPGMSILTAGSTPPNPGELLNSRKFRNLVESLTEQADIVIFDSPPLLAAADAVILASQMDGTVLVVETGATKKGAARRALQLLTQARATVLGIAFNKMRAHDGEGYYYYNYQYGTPAMINANATPVGPLLTASPDHDPLENDQE